MTQSFDDIIESLKKYTLKLKTKWSLKDGQVRTKDDEGFYICPLIFLCNIKSGQSTYNSNLPSIINKLSLEHGVAMQVMGAADIANDTENRCTLLKAVGLAE